MKAHAAPCHHTLAFRVEPQLLVAVDGLRNHLGEPRGIDGAGDAYPRLGELAPQAGVDVDGDEVLRLAHHTVLDERHPRPADHDAAQRPRRPTAHHPVRKSGQDTAQQRVRVRPGRRARTVAPKRTQELAPGPIDGAHAARVQIEPSAHRPVESGPRRLLEELGAMQQVGRARIGPQPDTAATAEGACLDTDVAFGSQRRQHRTVGGTAAPHRFAQQAGQARRHGQLEHAATGRREYAVRPDRPEVAQQALGPLHAGVTRRIEPADAGHIAQAPRPQLEQRRTQIEPQDLGHLALEAMRVLGGGPQTHTAAGRRPPGAPGALFGCRPADRRHAQGIDPVLGIEARDPRQARVDDRGDALDRQRGLGDVGRQHDLTLRAAADRPLLRLQRQVAVQWHHREPVQCRQRFERRRHAADLRRTGQEHQDVTRVGEIREQPADRCRHALDQPARVGHRRVLDRHRMGPPLGGEYRTIAEVRGQPLGLEGRRHDDQLQVGAHRVLQFTDHGQRHVPLQMPLVELVQHHDANRFQKRIAHELATEDALGEEPQARTGAARLRKADAIPDLVAHPSAAFGGDERRRGAGGDATWFQHDDLLVARQPRIEQRRRHTGRLARPRRGTQHDAVRRGQVLDERREQRVDRQRRHGHESSRWPATRQRRRSRTRRPRCAVAPAAADVADGVPSAGVRMLDVAGQPRRRSMDRMLRVNMTTLSTKEEPYPDEWIALGGRALSAKILLKEVDPKCDPLGPDNKLIFAPGCLSGSMAPTSGRMSVGGKSPLTHGIKEANAGGQPAQKLMRLGYRVVIVEGQPKDPEKRYKVTITKAGVKIDECPELKGLRTYAAAGKLAEISSKRAAFILCGPAGEARLTGASVALTDEDHRYPTRHAARGGLGAVMGAKGLKAVVVDDEGSQARVAKDAAGFKEVAVSMTKAYKAGPQFFARGTSAVVPMANMMDTLPTRNRREMQFEHANDIDGARINEAFETRGGGMHNCMTGCVVQCSNVVHGPDGSYVTSALEFETLVAARLELRHRQPRRDRQDGPAVRRARPRHDRDRRGDGRGHGRQASSPSATPTAPSASSTVSTRTAASSAPPSATAPCSPARNTTWRASRPSRARACRRGNRAR